MIVLLLRPTQDAVFFVLVVDTFAVFAVLGAEIEVAMKVENEHLTVIPHSGLLCVRGEGTKKETKHYTVLRLSGE